MSAVLGTIRNGQVKFDQALPWPEGTPVEVDVRKKRSGITEEEQGSDPESIARWIEWYRSLEPLAYSEKEEAENEAWMRSCGSYTPEQLKELDELFK